MTTLAQIIAVEKPKKSDSYREFTELHQTLSKQQLLSGISRTYRPVDDDGDQLPAEYTKVQIVAEQVLAKVAGVLSDMFNVVAIKDNANCLAKADIIVDGKAILKDVPVTYLLFLEKQLVDILTFLQKIPVLDPSERSWSPDTATGMWATEPYLTVKTKKTPRVLVKAEATKEHQAQVDVWHEDIVVGHWTTVKYSGAMPAERVNELVHRAKTLQTSVKFAREEANSREIDTNINPGKAIFEYLFS